MAQGNPNYMTQRPLRSVAGERPAGQTSFPAALSATPYTDTTSPRGREGQRRHDQPCRGHLAVVGDPIASPPRGMTGREVARDEHYCDNDAD